MKSARLGDVAHIERRSVDPSKIDPNTIYLGLEHLERGGRIIGHDTVGGAQLASSKYSFSAQHLLYGKLRPNLAKISRPTFTGVCSTDILPLLPGSQLDRDYLAHYLAQPSMVAFAASRATGANLPRLSPAVLDEFEIPLPPLEEQRRIAAILDQADALRVKRREVLAHLDSLASRRFSEAFAGRTWRVRPMGELVVEQQIGLDRSSEEQGAHRANGYLKMDAITREGQLDLGRLTHVDASVDEVRKYALSDGDLLLNTRNSRELVGKSAIYRGPAHLFNNNVLRIRFSGGVTPEYIHGFLWSAEGRRQLDSRKSGTTNVFAMYAKVFATIAVPVPPIEEQAAFTNVVKAIDSQKAKLRRCQGLADELFASLQARAFQGEL